MKKLLIAIAAIAVLLLCLPFGMGIMAKHTIENRYAHLNQVMGQSFHLELTDYQQGWFSSTAKVKVTLEPSTLSSALSKFFLPMLNAEYQPTGAIKFPLLVNLVIDHGPIIVQSKTPKVQFGMAMIHSTLDLPWNMQGRRWIQNIVGEKQLISTSSLISYSGDFSNDILIPNVHYIDSEKEAQLDWSGITLSTKFPSDAQKFEFAINVDNVLLSEKTKPVLGFIGMRALGQTAVENEKINTSLLYQVVKMDIHEQSYGPSSLVFSLRGLGEKEWNSISVFIREVNLGHMSEGQLALLSIQILPELVHMVNGATLDLNFITKTPSGDVSVKLDIETTGLNDGLIDPIALLKIFRGHGSFSMPKSMLKMLLANEAEIAINAENQLVDYTQSRQLAEKAADEHLATLQQEGWISAIGENYVGNYEYKEGQIIANGKVILDVFERYLN